MEKDNSGILRTPKKHHAICFEEQVRREHCLMKVIKYHKPVRDKITEIIEANENPFKRFDGMCFLQRYKEIEKIKVNPMIFRRLQKEDWLHIIGVCDKTLCITMSVLRSEPS